MATNTKLIRRQYRKDRIRRKVSGTSERPRLAVFRSNVHFYAQIIDDTAGKTLCACSSMDKELKKALKKTGNREAAEAVGKKIAERAASKKIKSVVFDRSGFNYHGRIKAFADSSRAAGLQF